MNSTEKARVVGEAIPHLVKVASYPINPQGRNPIHTDEYAKSFGMRGALVGGSTLLSYMLEMLLNYFGANWFSHGKIKVSFIGGGAINGDVLNCQGVITSRVQKATGNEVNLDIWIENQFGKKVLIGTASCTL